MNVAFFQERTSVRRFPRIDVWPPCAAPFSRRTFSLSLSLSLRFSLTSIHVTVIARVSARTPRERHYTLLRPMELRGNEEHRAPFLHATDR